MTVAFAAVEQSMGGSTASAPRTKAEFFAAASPFNRPIPTNPPLAAHGVPVIEALTANDAIANLVAYGVPIYTATASTPRQTVTCTRTAWGPCPLRGIEVPLRDSWSPNSGADGAMVVIDAGADRVYEFWQAARRGSAWTASWGAVSRLSGSGWRSTATGSGASRLGGVVRVAELRAGLIPHALVLQSDLACAQRFRAPATKTDGDSRSAACIPEGSRVQLDPALDLKKSGLTGAQLTIAKALQTYGAYVIDKAGTRLSVSFELARDASSDSAGSAYRAVGLTHDYERLDDIPWSKLRLLKRWTGR